MMPGVRQSNAWLHGWSGLLLGWLMFAIFLTGTISFFRQEVTLWMQPELHRAETAPRLAAAETGLAKLAEIAPDAKSWTVNLPSERNPTLRVSWNTEDERRGGRRGESGRQQSVSRQDLDAIPVARSPERLEAEAAARRANERGGRPRSPGLMLDPASGQVLTARETAGGEFLYHFHYQLYSVPREWGRWIVGMATFAMFVAILSGIITHKKIFRDFFTFRRSKGQRSWLDAHNAMAVLSLPFHLMITFSGLLLLGGTLLPWGSQAIFGADGRGASQREERAEERRVEALRDELAQKGAMPMMPIGSILDRGEALWGEPVGRFTVERPGRAGATVELAIQRNDSLLLRAGGGPARTLLFDGAEGTLLAAENGRAQGAIEGTDRVLSSLHLARFAPWGLRWIFFIAGAMGTIMVGTGLILWSIKRAEKLRGKPAPFGHTLVEKSNIGAIAGLLVATAAYFWANRLIPAAAEGRVDREIDVFFLIWLAGFLHPMARPSRSAWIEQLVVAGLLFAGLPVLNLASGGLGLHASLPAGNWLIASFDLVCLGTGLVLLLCARALAMKPSGLRPANRKMPAAPQLEPAE